jgi:hypothetical protein
MWNYGSYSQLVGLLGRVRSEMLASYNTECSQSV